MIANCIRKRTRTVNDADSDHPELTDTQVHHARAGIHPSVVTSAVCVRAQTATSFADRWFDDLKQVQHRRRVGTGDAESSQPDAMPMPFHSTSDQ